MIWVIVSSNPSVARADVSGQGKTSKLCWKKLYRETELYKAAIRLYTKPLFQWQKALTTSTDGQTLYDFARRGLGNLAAMHRDLERRQLVFRPGLALRRPANLAPPPKPLLAVRRALGQAHHLVARPHPQSL